MTTPHPLSERERVLGGLWGSLVGDALGVPVEFSARATVQANPVREMRGFGTHHQPAGTWSDDGALTLCTVDSLVQAEFDLENMGQRFVRWMNEELWTATGVVFDIGGATSDALLRIAKGIPAEQAGRRDEASNGNGSLMRILPVALRFAREPLESFASRLERASALTHGHARSRMACVFFGLVVRQLLQGRTPDAALPHARAEFSGRYAREVEFIHFKHLMTDIFASLPESEIVSTGYVLHTLHASLWSLLTTSSYEECVLKAVNLGGDTDTTGCVAGGIAGVRYGVEAIPASWLGLLPRQGEVAVLLQRFADLASSPAGVKQPIA